MIKKNQTKLNAINRLTDGVILFCSYVIATYIRFELFEGQLTFEQTIHRPYIIIGFVYAIVGLLLFEAINFYRPRRKSLGYEIIFEIILVNVLATGVITIALYYTLGDIFSRRALFYQGIIGSLLLITKHTLLRRWLRYLRATQHNLKHVIVLGNGHLAKEYMDSVKNHPELGYEVDGYISKYSKEELGTSLGSYEDLENILEKADIDELIVALEPHEIQFMKQVIDISEKQGTRLYIIPYYNDYIPASPSIEEVGNTKLINIRTIPLDNGFYAFIKRAFDIVLSLLVLLITSPILLLTAIGVKLSTKGSVIFKQERVGKNKKTFTMYKFRSMKENASEETGWSTDEDPRRTTFGSFIRKFSIDELPQFFNVLKGDMSIIGPRPEVPYYVDQFKETVPLYMIRHTVRPGITGWAQVNGYRGDTSIQKRIEYDIWYIEHWSIALDIKIFFKTIFGGLVNKETIRTN